MINKNITCNVLYFVFHYENLKYPCSLLSLGCFFLCYLPLKHRGKRHFKHQIITLIFAAGNVCAWRQLRIAIGSLSFKHENLLPAKLR